MILKITYKLYEEIFKFKKEKNCDMKNFQLSGISVIMNAC